MSTEFDSPWKEALDLYFEQFLALLFPAIHRQIDWSIPGESKDSDLRKIMRESELGTRTVDKLVKVQTLEGAEQWVLIHIEVQTTPQREFARRMYVYNYRIFDRYNKSVASLAVLADEDPDWRPTEYRNTMFGCEVGIRFPTIKLLDVALEEAALEASDNPFAKIVLAHRKTQDTRKNPQERHAWKFRLIRGLYERGLSEAKVREIFRLIDWMMVLPEPLDLSFWQDVDKMQKEKQMPYLSTPERVGHWRGLWRGIEVALKIRFGEAGLQLVPLVHTVHGTDRLEAILKILENSGTLDDVRRECEKPQPEWIG